MAKKTEKNPKGAGRPTVENGRVSLSISGKKEQLDELRYLAQKEEMTISQYVFTKCGVIQCSKCRWHCTEKPYCTVDESEEPCINYSKFEKGVSMNNWYVANDCGDVAGHDLSETKARILAQELNQTVWYLSYGEGMVSYDNQPTSDFDNAMKFDTEEEAERYRDEVQKEWVDQLKVASFTDDTNWEALCDDED